MFLFMLCVYWSGAHRDLPVLTHSFPTRRSSDLERMIIAFGDIAALRGIDRRRLDQRARQFVNERAMAVESGEQPREQRRKIGPPREPLAEQPRDRKSTRLNSSH